MKEKLKQILRENSWNITEEVIKEILKYDDCKSFFNLMMRYWAESWIVKYLVSFKWIHMFFDKHYEEIEGIRKELEERWMSVDIPLDADLRSFLVWLSFEKRVYELYAKLEYTISTEQ